jgi:hypothetical protein
MSSHQTKTLYWTRLRLLDSRYQPEFDKSDFKYQPQHSACARGLQPVCTLYAACCMLHLACCILHATRCMPPVGCCTLSVVCWMLYMDMLRCTSLVARCIMPRRIQAHRRVARPPALPSAAPRRSVYHGHHTAARVAPTGSDFKLNATPSAASSSQATKRT